MSEEFKYVFSTFYIFQATRQVLKLHCDRLFVIVPNRLHFFVSNYFRIYGILRSNSMYTYYIQYQLVCMHVFIVIIGISV